MRLHQLAPLLVSLIVACGGGKPTTSSTAPMPRPDPIRTTPGPDCRAVAEQLATVLHADRTQDPQAAGTTLSETLNRRCQTDQWSDEARSCLGSAQSQPELDGCAKLLSEPQRKAFAASAEEPKSDVSPKTPRTTRGPVKKDKSHTGDSDPCDGGE